MKSVRHWNPHYIVARSREMLDQKLHPTDPWLTRKSIDLLDQLLRPTDVALEFGSGRSTRWIGRRVAHLTSIEHDESWHKTGLERLRREKFNNVDLILKPLDVPEAEGGQAAYVRILDGIADDSLDFCLVDGMYRGYCAAGVVAKMKSGGMVAIDNAGWFLPSQSRSPGARPPGSGTYDAAWDRFVRTTDAWRRIWTTSGVTDTVILFKS